jgi:hypothetical protein
MLTHVVRYELHLYLANMYIIYVRLVIGSYVNSSPTIIADILIVRSITRVDELLIGKSSVKYIATASTGYDHIDTDYLKARAHFFDTIRSQHRSRRGFNSYRLNGFIDEIADTLNNLGFKR